jgi:hypothetical protein
MTTNLKDTDRLTNSDQARADLLRRANALGVSPFVSLEDFVGDPEIISDFDVDAFLQQVREDRDQQSGRRSTDGDPGH